MNNASGFYGTGWLALAAIAGTVVLLFIADSVGSSGRVTSADDYVLMFPPIIAMVSLTLAALMGLIPAAIAKKKGRSFALWWLYGTLLFIAALVHSLLMAEDIESVERRQLQSGMERCPYCAEIIKAEAKVCKHCGRDLPAAEAVASAGPTKVGELSTKLKMKQAT